MEAGYHLPIMGWSNPVVMSRFSWKRRTAKEVFRTFCQLQGLQGQDPPVAERIGTKGTSKIVAVRFRPDWDQNLKWFFWSIYIYYNYIRVCLTMKQTATLPHGKFFVGTVMMNYQSPGFLNFFKTRSQDKVGQGSPPEFLKHLRSFKKSLALVDSLPSGVLLPFLLGTESN